MTKQPEIKAKTNNIKPVRIEKYIPANVWRDIESSCGTSVHLLHSILHEVSLINMDYTGQPCGAKLQYIEKNTGIQTVSSLMTAKGGRAATQKIESADKRRIVWTIVENTMVAIIFYKSHDKSVFEYNSIAISNAQQGLLMDGETQISKSLVKDDSYLKVADLLKQYNIQNENPHTKHGKKSGKTNTPKRPQAEQQNVLSESERFDIKMQAFIRKLRKENDALNEKLVQAKINHEVAEKFRLVKLINANLAKIENLEKKL